MAYISKRKKLYITSIVVIAVVAAVITIFAFVIPKHKTIHFHKDICESVIVEKGDLMPTLPTPSKEGYEFKGWYYSLEFSDQTQVKPGVDVVNNDVVLYPMFNILSYNVSFNLNGGKGEQINSFIKNYNQEFVFPTKESANINNDGLDLKGWCENSSGVGDVFAPGTTFNVPSKNITFYAIWNYPTTIINYITGDGGNYIAPQQARTGELVPVNVIISSVEKTGYKFSGWCFDEGCTQLVDFTKYILTGDSVNFYAKWEPVEYKATFYVDGSEYVVSSAISKIYYDSYVIKPVDPQKANAVFEGWYLDEQFTIKYDFAKKVTGNVVLYAKWQEEVLQPEA